MKATSGLLPWFLQRITGAILSIGLITHFIVLHFATSRPVTIQKVAERFAGAGWIVFDSILLVVCVYHALNGLNSIILDFPISARTGKVLSYVFWLGGIVLAVVGIANLLPLKG